MSVIFFIIAPAQTAGIITLLLFTILCAIVFINQFLSIKCQRDWKTLSSLICISVTGTISVSLVVMITLLFITLVDNGLQSSGMGGFILSIIPPIIALVIGLYVNRDTLDNFWHRSTSSKSKTNSTENCMITGTFDARGQRDRHDHDVLTPMIQN
jgi:sterol desaturase/sphingolipid hydroxylase (fatty acid hydroxylase superfamily)